MRLKILFIAAVTVLFAGFLAVPPSFAQAGKMCKTPDGFVFGDERGMGGTGRSDERGIGGTGIQADIGVYGRITAFGSICVNGMHIKYDNDTPVLDANRISSPKALKIGQIVAVRVSADKNDFKAKTIGIEKILSGPVSGIEPEKDKITVLQQTVLVSTRARAALKALRVGDYVSVSGLRRADGVIVAGHIERVSTSSQFVRKEPSALFGRDVKSFSVQGYVKMSDKKGLLRLADGRSIRIPEKINARPAYNDRVIIFGQINKNGVYIADKIITEHALFNTGMVIPPLRETEKGNNDSAPGSSPASNDLSLPPLPPVNDGGVPTLELPALPSLPGGLGGDLPALPPINIPLPPVLAPIVPEIPALPPIALPELPPIAPPVVPDIHLPILK